MRESGETRLPWPDVGGVAGLVIQEVTRCKTETRLQQGYPLFRALNFVACQTTQGMRSGTMVLCGPNELAGKLQPAHGINSRPAIVGGIGS